MVEYEKIEEFLKKAYGFEKLYPHQVEAINHIAEDTGVLVTVPTASGKTVVAVGAIYKALMEGKKAVYVSPLVALSSEKFLEFTEIFHARAEELGLPRKYNVALSTGATYKFTNSESLKLKKAGVIVTTNEKLDSIIRRKPKWIKDIGVIVLDEVHLMYDPGRGSTLEIVQTYFKYLKDNGDFEPIIVALSATVGNPEDIADWLDVEVVESNFRPVELVKLIYDAEEKKLIQYDGMFFKNEQPSKSFANIPIDFVVDRFKNGKQVVTFVAARKYAESLARDMTKYAENYVTEDDKKAIAEAISDWGDTPIEEKLKEYMLKGTAFHHAGLSFEMRAAVEDLFRRGHIKFIAATPSISIGVNLPANTVIIRDVKRWTGKYSAFLPNYEIEQMLGRAGRPQYDDIGYGIIVAKNQIELDFIEKHYINPKISPVYSPLLMSLTEVAGEYDGINSIMATKLASSILGIINVLGAPTKEDIKKFFELTYMNYTIEYGIIPYWMQRYEVFQVVEDGLDELITDMLEYLEDAEMIKMTDDEKIKLTGYGKKVMELYITPRTAEIIRHNLDRLDTEISVISLVLMLPEMGRTALSTRSRLNIPEAWDENDYRDFYYAHKSEMLFERPPTLGQVKMIAVIYDWINGVDNETIMLRHNVLPGELFRISSNVRWLAFAVSQIYRIVNKEENEMLEKLVQRLEYGVTEEALELVSLRGVGRVRAQKLLAAGIKSIDDLAVLTPEELKKILGVKGDKLVKDILNQARVASGLPTIE